MSFIHLVGLPYTVVNSSEAVSLLQKSYSLGLSLLLSHFSCFEILTSNYLLSSVCLCP